jgi:1,4-alpha-glucan branching enzyme
MIYLDHGLGSSVNSYDHYFCSNVDEDAVTYLGVANTLIHELRPDAITIAEEVSGMPGLASPIEDAGVGFNYRLAMGTPDYWIKLLKHKRDEDWNVSELWHELTNKRAEEKTIGYAESHDQALVGDKTLMFWLADKEMYWHMQVDDESLVIDRAMALHKMIRLITCSTAGDGYLTFMGNEFGHPEWVDFPREGNGWSHHYARRQWSLPDNPALKYRFLAQFDRAMIELVARHKVLDEPWPYKHYEHVDDMVLAFERAGLLFVFNFHPTNSYPSRSFGVRPGEYSLVLDTDSKEFGGHGRVDPSVMYRTSPSDSTLTLYIPSRTGLVFAR